MERQRVTHSIPPTYDENSRVLVLGSIPSPKSRELGFNYGHPQNRFWRVLAQLSDEPLPDTNGRKRDFCLRHHIALWDVLAACEIDGASDASISDAVPNDLRRITDCAPIEAVFCTGAKAHELYMRLCEADVGLPAVKLPSTSPANAACGMERLLAEYAAIFEHTHEPAEHTMPVADVVALEQTIAAAGTPLAELMDRAGAAVAHRVEGILDDLAAGTYPPRGNGCDELARHIQAPAEQAEPLVAVLCGNGNNGGDGWVAAARLAQAGVRVCVLTAKLPDRLQAQPAHDAAMKALEVLQKLGAQVLRAADALPHDARGQLTAAPLVLLDDGAADQRDGVLEALQRARVVVDAMLGTGASRYCPRSPFLDWIVAANSVAGQHARLAVDVPSGIDADTGAAASTCFTADETLTMMVRKPGLSAAECGLVSVAPLAYLEPFLN